MKIQKLQKQGDELERMISNLIDVQVKNPNLSQDDFNNKYQSLTSQLHNCKTEIRRLEGEFITNYDTRSRLAMIETKLSNLLEPIQDVDSDTLRSFIYKIISVTPENIILCVSGTKNYTDK